MTQPANTPIKTRFPRTIALDVARELCRDLKPLCVNLIVAGSLRRGKPDVGDVEILYIPRLESRRIDLLRSAGVSLADEWIDVLVARGVLARRKSKIGTISWGEKNKLAVHCSTGMPVDFFAASKCNWFNYLVCRTGPAASNIRIAAAAKAKGYQWNPYGPGFTHLETGHIVKMNSEESVFDFVGLPYLPPKDRS